MHFGAIGLELRFVSHGADQRMPKRVLSAWCEPHLVDELGDDQFVHAGIDPQAQQ